MKKTVSILLSLLMLISAFSVPVIADDTEQRGDFIYTAGTNEIVDYVGDLDNCVIPEGVTIKSLGKSGYKITKITLNNNSDWEKVKIYATIKEVIFTDNVTEITYGSTIKENYLEKITIPSSVTKINNRAFEYAQLTELNLPDSIEYIGDYAFANCKLSGDFVLPQNVKYIGIEAFRESKFDKVVLPDSLEFIAYNSFKTAGTINYPDYMLENPPEDGFINADNITFSVSLSELSGDVIDSLKGSNWYENNIKSVKENSQDADFTMFENTLVEYNGNDKNVVIPDGVKYIGASAFAKKNIRTVTIPDSVETISTSAFMNTGLMKITIPKSVKKLGVSVFSGCLGLKKVIFEGAPEIGSASFDGSEEYEGQIFERCYALTKDNIIFKDSSIVIPKNFYKFTEETFSDTINSTDKTMWGEPLLDYYPDSTYLVDLKMTVGEYKKGAAAKPSATADPKSTVAPKFTAAPSASAAPTATAAAATPSPKTLDVKNDNGKIDITADNRAVTFPDAQPFIDANNRTQVPIRAVGETLDCTVSWDGETNTATIAKDDTTVKITVGSSTLTVNGKPITMDTEAVNVQDRVHIPVRFIAEALGYTVEYED